MPDCSTQQRAKRRRLPLLCAALGCVLGLPWKSVAGSLDGANELLQVTRTGEQFENLAAQQAQHIIDMYVSIVEMAVAVQLPATLQNQIADCYARVYRWEKYADGIADILARELTQEQLMLLTDFYNNEGLPPDDIDLFKHTIGLAQHITTLSSEYIFNNSSGCVENDAQLIQQYLRGHPELDAVEAIEFPW